MTTNNRRIHAQRVVDGANRDLSSALGMIESMVEIIPEYRGELDQMACDIQRIQKRLDWAAGSVS